MIIIKSEFVWHLMRMCVKTGKTIKVYHAFIACLLSAPSVMPTGCRVSVHRNPHTHTHGMVLVSLAQMISGAMGYVMTLYEKTQIIWNL